MSAPLICKLACQEYFELMMISACVAMFCPPYLQPVDYYTTPLLWLDFASELHACTNGTAATAPKAAIPFRKSRRGGMSSAESSFSETVFFFRLSLSLIMNPAFYKPYHITIAKRCQGTFVIVITI